MRATVFKKTKKILSQSVTKLFSVSILVAALAACGSSSSGDSGGNSSLDTEEPVITLYGNEIISVQLGSNYTELSATANDNVDGVLAVTTTGTVDTDTEGSYTVTYTATDAAGNVATETRTVNIVASVTDATPPVITLDGNAIITIVIGDSFTDPGATAVDAVDGTLMVTTSGTVDDTIGRYTLVYTATDAAGNTASKIRTINILSAPDTTAPVTTLTGAAEITIDANSIFTDPGATATDNIDGAVTVNTTGIVDINTPGTYTLSYSAVDSSGNDATVVTRTVIVPDTTAPVITLTDGSIINLFVGENFNEPGATAVDDKDGIITVNISGDTVDTSATGIYTLIYTATDTSNNETSVTRTVNVAQVSQLNDTGITVGGWLILDPNGNTAGNNPDCSTGHNPESEIPEAQDCSHGRDADGSLNKTGAGLLGFDYTKLDTNGDDLTADAANWNCVKDNHTNLIWEVKTTSGLHNTADQYNWYNTNPNTNAGDNGFENNDAGICDGYSAGDSASYCNTQAFVTRVNTAGLCGDSDWRMPTREELRSIVHYNNASPAIDNNYFPNTATSFYWSSTPYADTTDYFSWGVGFTGGSDDKYLRNGAYKIRLVRDAE